MCEAPEKRRAGVLVFEDRGAVASELQGSVSAVCICLHDRVVQHLVSIPLRSMERTGHRGGSRAVVVSHVGHKVRSSV